MKEPQNFFLLDTETTGIGANAQVVQLAFLKVPNEREKFLNLGLLEPIVHYFRPSVPIDIRASEVHGLFLKDLIKYPLADGPNGPKLPENCDVLIAHNAAFDHRMLGKPKVKLFCTLKLAKTFFTKEKPTNHKLDTLINEICAPKLLETNEVSDPTKFYREAKFHQADQDVWKLYWLLYYIFQNSNFQSLTEIQTFLGVK